MASLYGEMVLRSSIDIDEYWKERDGALDYRVDTYSPMSFDNFKWEFSSLLEYLSSDASYDDRAEDFREFGSMLEGLKRNGFKLGMREIGKFYNEEIGALQQCDSILYIKEFVVGRR